MAAAASSSSEITNDGPVLNLINKRLRALRKKLNRIAQMEESLAQGKTLNKEQEETFRSKSSVLASIDELEKLRQPLSQAISEEIQLSLEKKDEKSEALVAQETPSEEKTNETDGSQTDGPTAVAELLQLMYFGSTFDVKTLMSAHENMVTRTHERSSCLTYDYVTDDDAAGDPLNEWDLDLISMLGGLLISRPANTSLSHKNALRKCVEHAKLWLASSEQPIEPNSNITYASLREKLNKIMASDYYTTTPEIKAPVEVGAAGGSYTSYEIPLYGSAITPDNMTIPVESSSTGYQQEEGKSSNSHGSEIYDAETVPVEEHHQGEPEVENTSEQAQTGSEVDQNLKDLDSKEEQQQQQYPSRRSHQNYRGGRGGPGRRAYSNGRGGRGTNRGGGGGYHQIGRGQSYEQTGVYYPNNRNFNNYRGRGGRGGTTGGNYSNYHGPASQAQEAS